MDVHKGKGFGKSGHRWTQGERGEKMPEYCGRLFYGWLLLATILSSAEFLLQTAIMSEHLFAWVMFLNTIWKPLDILYVCSLLFCSLSAVNGDYLVFVLVSGMH